MEIHHDWEFLENGMTIRPISVALVAEDGRSYHAVLSDLPVEGVRTHPWLGKHVWPKLPLVTVGDEGREVLSYGHPLVKHREVVRAEVLRFIMGTDRPSLWGWYPSYDHVCLAQLFGTMVQLPSCVPQRTNDVAQEWERLGYPRLPEQPRGTEHHPLADARWSLFLRRYLRWHELTQAGLTAYLSVVRPEVPTAEGLMA